MDAELSFGVQAELERKVSAIPRCERERMQMNVLFLTHRVPYPPNRGDKIRSFNILRHLLQRHEVYLGCLVDDEADLTYLPEVERMVTRVMSARVFPKPKKLFALGGFLCGTAISVTYFYSRSLQRQIDDLLDMEDFDAVFCFSSPMAEYVFRSRHARGKMQGARRVMDLIDVDSHKWRQYAESHAWWARWIYRREATYLAAYEKRIASNFDRVLVVSEHEKRLFPGRNTTGNVEAMANGVDLEYFHPPHEGSASDRPTLVFTGVMDYWPNVEGVCWFVTSVLPLIHEAVPDVAMFVVGSRPTPEIVRLGRDAGIVVTGFVEDVRSYLAAASVCVAPLRIARGIQNKVLEAMAMGKAVVCTSQAQEGIRAQAGRDLIVADGAPAFARATIELLKDPARAESIGARARRCVEVGYTWRENLGALERWLGEPTASRSPEGRSARFAGDAGALG